MSKNLTCKNYDEAAAILAGGRNPDYRTVCNNTRLIRRSETEIAVQLHGTDVVTYTADGGVILSSGGWRTVTTRARMCTFSPLSIAQVSGAWFVSPRNEKYDPDVRWPDVQSEPYWGPAVGFRDGMMWHPVTGFAGHVTPEEIAERDARNRRVRARISKFVRGITAEQVAEAVAAGHMGDCIICQVRGTDCLESHMEENYVHLTLLTNSQASYWLSDDPERVNVREIRRLLGRYLRQNLLEDVCTR